jgi:hydroxyacylglutathione hydrolase
MKRDNRDGVPLLGNLPQPRHLTSKELGELATGGGPTMVVDTRMDRSGFMAKHLPGSLYAPMNRSFNTVVGSLVVDETTPLVLVLEDNHLDEAIRDLVRIGYDNVVGYITPDGLEKYFDEGGESGTIPEATFDDVAAAAGDPGVTVVDVRFASEAAGGKVPGAVNASYTRLPEYEASRIPRGGRLMVHCEAGGRAAAAASFLAREGYDVTFVNGPFSDYASRHEVERPEPAGV